MSEAVSFEAKLYAYRKGRDGLIVSFVVLAQDIPNELALADIGQRFGVAIAQLREGEEDPPAPPAAEPKPTAPKNELRSERAKVDYRTKPAAEQAVVRAARLCTELRFQTWLEQHCAGRGIVIDAQPSTDTTAELLRRCIGVHSRKEIAENPAACQRFLSVEIAYKEFIGGIAERRG